MTRHSGHTHDMEFTLELENSDLDIVFESDLLSENFSDRTEVQWKFHYGTHTRVMADVFDSSPASESVSCDLLPTLRLRCGHDA